MDQTISYYEKNGKEFCRTTRDADMSSNRNRFLKLLEQKYFTQDITVDGRSVIHILDAGCGSGRDAKAFVDAGYQVTAVDASAQICGEAEKLLGQKVFCLRFEELEFSNKFDGIWACASLLHVPYGEISGVLKRLWNALKEDGVIYASFKYGEGERTDRGRTFYNYKESNLRMLMERNCFCIEDLYVTQDVRNGREEERWVNVLSRKEEVPGKVKKACFG